MSFFKKFLIDDWNVGIIEKTIDSVLSGESYTIRFLKHKYRDRFFADPFLYKCDDLYYYILAEEYKFYEKKGRIVLLKIDRKTMRLLSKNLVLEETCHLSYPFYENHKMTVESFRNGGFYIYDFDGEKAKNKTLLIDLPLIDGTPYITREKTWIFGTLKDESGYGANEKLYIYSIGEKCESHQMNPVKNDISSSRPGGHFFKAGEYLYRPVQDCELRYGNAIKIMKINELSINAFSEEEVMVVSSCNAKKYNMGLHTFNVEDGFIVVDGFRQFWSLKKVLYVKFSKLLSRLDKEYKQRMV